MTTITTPMGTSTPVTWMELATSRHGSSRVATGPGGAPVAVIHGPRPRARASSLVLLYDDEDAARLAEDLHAYGGICHITDPDRPTHSMFYVVSGAISRQLDTTTARVWILTIEVTEIPT